MQLTERMSDAAGEQVLEKTVTYLYDAAGNELSQKVSYLRPHTRDMRQVTGGSPHGGQAEQPPGELLEKVTNRYDGFNRLKATERVKAGERVEAAFVYDGDGLRTRKETRSSADGYAPQVTNYLYDRQYVILETDGADKLSVRYVRGINYIARIDNTERTSYFLYNGHGDVVQTVNASGEVENQYDYDVFGSVTLTLEVYANAIRYAGEFYDTETGLIYLRARYYNPYVGRFITEDSYWGEDANPLSLNRYTYTHNNPIMYVDPTGHWVESDKNLDLESQAKIIALTSAYYNAAPGAERSAIQAQAEGIRTQSKKSVKGKVITPLIFQAKEIEQVADEAIAKRGYMTGADWQKALKKGKIESKLDYSKHTMSTGTATGTTTTIGRTVITVNSQSYKDSKNELVGESKLSMGYKVTEQEKNFVASIASNSDITLEQTLVVLDLLHEKKGKITNADLTEYGIENTSSFFGMDSTDDHIMMVYDLSQKGMTLYEADLAFQQQQMDQISAAFGVKVFTAVGGGFSISSKRGPEVAIATPKVNGPAVTAKGTGKGASSTGKGEREAQPGATASRRERRFKQTKGRKILKTLKSEIGFFPRMKRLVR